MLRFFLDLIAGLCLINGIPPDPVFTVFRLSDLNNQNQNGN